MSGTVARTVGQVLVEARALLSDKVTPYRYTDDELLEAFNGLLLVSRSLRPDLFFGYFSLRKPLPNFAATDPFPIDLTYFQAFVFGVVGRGEMREDTFTNDQRALQMMAQFTTGLKAA